MEQGLVEIRYNTMTTASTESFKVLRTNLIYSEGVQVITMTSVLPNEGKTITSFNLAKSFAQINKRVLLIDADLRKGSLKRFFTVRHKVAGLSEALSRQSGQIIEETTIPNPTELLSGEIFENIINRLRNAYDYIIIDTPPMNVAMDAAIIGRVTDGVVLVVRNDFVKKQDLKRIKLQLERNGARVIGSVLNRVKKDQVDYKSYGYEYYYEEK